MKVILEEQARGNPAPGLPNHHLPQALCLLSDFSRVLRFAPTFQAAEAIVCKIACESTYLHLCYISQAIEKNWQSLCDFSQCHTFDHGVLTMWKESEQFIVHTAHSVATKVCVHIFTCATEHVWESENKIRFWPRLLPWMRRNQFIAFCCVCQASMPTSFRRLSSVHLQYLQSPHKDTVIADICAKRLTFP